MEADASGVEVSCLTRSVTTGESRKGLFYGITGSAAWRGLQLNQALLNDDAAAFGEYKFQSALCEQRFGADESGAGQ